MYFPYTVALSGLDKLTNAGQQPQAGGQAIPFPVVRP